MLVPQYNNVCCPFAACLVAGGLYAAGDCGFYQDWYENNGEDPEFKVSIPSPDLFSANALLTATILVALITGQYEHPTALCGAPVLPDP